MNYLVFEFSIFNKEDNLINNLIFKKIKRSYKGDKSLKLYKMMKSSKYHVYFNTSTLAILLLPLPTLYLSKGRGFPCVGDINPMIHKLFGLARPTFVVNIWRSRSQGRGFESYLPT